MNVLYRSSMLPPSPMEVYIGPQSLGCKGHPWGEHTTLRAVAPAFSDVASPSQAGVSKPQSSNGGSPAVLGAAGQLTCQA